MKRLLPILLLLCLLPVPAAAQETPTYPTVDALSAADVPPRDLLALAGRLEGVTTVAPPPENPAPLEVGTVRTLWADNTSANYSFQFEAELAVVGDHIYIWQQQGAGLPLDGLQALADDFDTNVYQQTRDVWGEEASPGVDGDPRIHAVFVGDLGFGLGAYYAAKHSYPIEAVPTSNEMEMMFYNLDALGGLVGTDVLVTITAHEFQHMIRANVDQNEAGWMDEGFSTFTEWYLGDGDLGFATVFLQNPNTQLNTWTEEGNRTADYGAAFLWVTYLYERFGVEGLRELSLDPANGFFGVDNLAQSNNRNVDALFADWVVANYLIDPTRTNSPAYGYNQLAGLRPATARVVDTLPVDLTRQINQYAAEYIRVNDLGGASAVQVEVTAPEVVGLAPMESPSGTPMWYSNRGDDSNTTLTFPVDLTNATAPQLTYDVWYHIENLWDYGYLMASADGGASWDILQTPAMTTENPHFNAFGPGYSGRSDGWLTETIDLSAYAGRDILLRYEMIYDDAVNQPGMFLDALTIMDGAEMLLSTDFSDETLTSEARGWILTDNRLPQQVWVQAIVGSGPNATVTRWRHTGGTATYDLPLPGSVTHLTVALSPFATTTTVPVEVGLRVTAE